MRPPQTRPPGSSRRNDRAPSERPRPSRVPILDLIGLLTLIVFPTLNLLRLGRLLDPRWVFGYAVFVSIFTFLLYRHDKKRAQSSGWRTPEAALHFFELMGGWPGAFLAQRVLRHKISKVSYQVKFGIIIALHEFASFDALQNWLWTRQLFRLLG